MANVKLWFDEEGDFLEVTFSDGKGYLKEVAPDVYQRVDADGNLLGFSIFSFLKRDRQPIEVPLEVVAGLTTR